MAPRGEERDVEIGDGGEGSWHHEEVTEVSAECDGGASGALEVVPFPAD